MRKICMSLFLLLLVAYLYPTAWVLENSNSKTLIEINFDEPGNPELSLVAIPNGANVEIKILQEEKLPLLTTKFETNERIVQIIERGVWRDYEVVTLKFYPQVKDNEGNIYFVKKAKIELSYREGYGYPTVISPTFTSLYQAYLINFPFIIARIQERSRLQGEGARYLIIVPDAFYDALVPLAEWKTQKGMLAKIATLSETGSTQSEIKSYIQNAYYTWDIRPEFVLLAGDYSYIPLPYSQNDHYYAMIAGSDDHDDVVIGRLPAENLTQIQTMVSKILGYEKDPYMDDTLWFKKGTTIVNEDGDWFDDSIYWDDAHYAATLMVTRGYVHVDSFSAFGGDDQNDVINAINNGRTFLLYRGQGVGYWWSPFDVNPNYTNNGFKLPVVISATCTTLGSDVLGESFLRVGTPTTPKGAVGFLGTTTVRSGVAHIRSYIAKGFFEGVFSYNLYQLGHAVNHARLKLYQAEGNDYDYWGFMLLGDPELNLWTDTPGDLIVNHPAAVPPGDYDLSVTVTSAGNPVKNALVCARVDTIEYAWGYTNANGEVTLSLTLPDTGTLQITVTAQNYKYYEGTATIASEGPFVSLVYHSLNDLPNGNGDGQANPGETIFVNISLLNYGTQTAFQVFGKLSTNSPYVVVIDSTEEIGDIAPGDTADVPNAFQFSVLPNTPDGEVLNFDLTLIDSEGDTWSTWFSDPIYAAKVEILSFIVIDTLSGGNGNGEPDPGESFILQAIIKNSGSMGISNLYLDLALRDFDPFVAITDPSSHISQLNPGDSVILASDPFAMSTSPLTPPMHHADLQVIAIGTTETYDYNDTLPYTMTIGTPGPDYPTGPDDYGYYAIDNGDSSFVNCPTYEWIEIAPPGPGELITEITNQDADTVTLPLPFTFKFYGIEYDSIGVCSNGFLELGKSTYRFSYNDPIPTEGGPRRMLAPFWCDLDPSYAGDIYQWYDASNHRWIVEFKNVVHYGGNYPETFEVILYDPAYYSTPTGDGEILFQYKTVSNPNVCTVGIEDSTETIGIQYLYNGSYAETAHPLQNGRAILFTTKIPVPNDYPWAYLDPDYVIVDSTGGNGNGIPENGETFELYLGLHNGGNVQVSDLYAYLYPLSDNCTVLDSQAFYGNIEPEEIKWNYEDPFIVSVSSSPNDSIMDFELHLAANSGSYSYYLYFSIPISINVNVSENSNAIPDRFYLTQNYPNPYKGYTVIEFAISQKVKAKLEIYDISGRKVTTLLNETKDPGYYRIIWNGMDSRGKKVPSGIYFYRLKAGKFVKTRKMVLLKR